MRPARAPAPQVPRASTVWAVVRAAFSFALSVAIHLAIASPAIVWLVFFAEPMLETPGDEGPEDAALGNDGGEVPLGEPEPMSVSLYVEPPPGAVPAEAPPAPGPAAAPARSPVEGTAEGDPNTTTISPAERMGVRGRRPRGERKPCETIDEIVAVSDDKWRVERDVLDYYAAHLRELQKQVAVSTHAGPDGKPDGVRVFLPRCSVLRQAGIKHGDIIHSINGRRVATLTDGITTYLALRNSENLQVELSRKNGVRRVHRYRLKQ